MAGDWIKVEHTTIDKPEVLAMAELMGLEPEIVFAKLFRVWCWFDKQSRDGNAGSVTDVTLMKFIDRYVNAQGFASSMKKVGWLTNNGVPNFERHNGESAKKRALTAERVKRYRNAENVTEALPEKRREEKKNNKAQAPFVAPDWVPSDAWADYLAMRTRIRKHATDRAKALTVAALAKLRDQGHDPRAVLEQSIQNSWQGVFPLKAAAASKPAWEGAK